MTALSDKLGNKWTALGLLWSLALLNYLDRLAITSVFPLLRTELKITDVGLGCSEQLFLSSIRQRHLWLVTWETGSHDATWCCGL